MPVLPKQPDETEAERAGVWSSPLSPPVAWNSRRHDDGVLSGDDVAYCCLPTGCPNYLTDPICLNDLGDAVKVSGARQFCWLMDCLGFICSCSIEKLVDLPCMLVRCSLLHYGSRPHGTQQTESSNSCGM